MKSNQFLNDPPGVRFVNLYGRVHAGHKGIAITSGCILLSLALILVGAWPALLSGGFRILLIAIAAALLLAQLRVVLHWCDVAEVAIREIVRVGLHH